MRWTYPDVLDLPATVYAILVEELLKESNTESEH
jgi:hypothetical protein